MNWTTYYIIEEGNMSYIRVISLCIYTLSVDTLALPFLYDLLNFRSNTVFLFFFGRLEN